MLFYHRIVGVIATAVLIMTTLATGVPVAHADTSSRTTAVIMTTLATGVPVAHADTSSRTTAAAGSLASSHSARIRHRADSAVSRITACKDAASDTACKTGSKRVSLKRGERTPKGDWDGYFCPAYHACRTYYGAFYTAHPRKDHTYFVKVSGCFGCTKEARVM